MKNAYRTGVRNLSIDGQKFVVPLFFFFRKTDAPVNNQTIASYPGNLFRLFCFRNRIRRHTYGRKSSSPSTTQFQENIGKNPGNLRTVKN